MEVPKTANEMREVLDMFLARGNDESSILWNFLTGLRGCDTNGFDTPAWVKGKTSCRVRRAGLPMTAAVMDDVVLEWGNAAFGRFVPWTGDYTEHPPRKKEGLLHYVPSHFVDHYEEAILALDRMGIQIDAYQPFFEASEEA